MPSQVRQPRLQILIEGNPVPLAEGSVNVSRHARSDTFQASTALQATGRPLGYWASVGPVECIVQACNDIADGWVTLLRGALDTVEVRADAREGVKIHFSGRDNSAKLIDNKTTARRLNKKSSDIVKELAEKYGLQADVDDTGDESGKVHTQDHTHLEDNDTAWNTIARLAEREGAFLYFKDDTVYFKQPGSDGAGGTYPIRFTPPDEDATAIGSIIAIQLTQNVHLNKGIKQTVRSWHTRKEKNVVATKEPRQGSAGGISNPPLPPARPSDLSVSGSAGGISNPPLPPRRPLEFVEHIPGLTDDQAEKIATKKQIERQRHEMQIEVIMPGDVDFDARMMIELSGTGSAWDQQYHCNTCTHQFSTFNGYTMRISAQNKKGGEGGGEDTGAGGTDPNSVPETQGPNQPQNVPLPPSRPSDLGGSQTVPLPPTRPRGL